MKLSLEANIKNPPALTAEGWPTALLRALDSEGLLEALTQIGSYEDGFSARGSIPDAAAWIAAQGYSYSQLRSDQLVNEYTPREFAYIFAGERSSRVLLSLHPEPADIERAASRLVGLALRLPDVFGGSYLWDFGVCIDDIGWELPEDFDRTWSPDAFLAILSRRFHEEHRLGQPTRERALREDPLPEGVTREIRGDLTLIRWASDLSDLEAVRAGLDRQQGWLAAHPEPPREEAAPEPPASAADSPNRDGRSLQLRLLDQGASDEDVHRFQVALYERFLEGYARLFQDIFGYDYLYDVSGDEEHDRVLGRYGAELDFTFSKAGGMCPLSCQLAAHWLHHMIVTDRDFVEELAAEHGVRLAPIRQTTEDFLRAPGSPRFIELRDYHYGFGERDLDSWVETDHLEKARSWAKLTAREKKAIRELRASGRCGCRVCKAS